jgi:coatomer subunit beta
MEVRRKAISIVLSMTTSRTVEDVVMFLKKQLQRSVEQEMDKVCRSDQDFWAPTYPCSGE